MKTHEENADPVEEDRGQTVLIIDDDAASIGVISDCLEDSGFVVLVARNGESGIEKARYARPDIIFLDVLMPGIDGFETCRRLKSDPTTAGIPVIFMTSLTDTEDKVIGFEAGAVEYVTKPFQNREILLRVRMQLRLGALTRELQQTSEELTKHRDRLEELVEERTEEIKSANLQLQNEITERKQAEEAQQVERDRLTAVFKAMKDGVYIVSQDYDIEYVNPVLTAEFGPPDGRKCYAYFHDQEAVCPWCKNQDVFAGRTVHWEWYSPTNDRTYDLIDTPLRNADGTISKLEIFRDITERKQAEEALRESEQRYHVIMEASLQGTCQVDAQGRITFANPATAELTGYSLAELDGLSLDTLFPPGEAKAISDANVALLYSGKPIVGENTLTRKDGSRIETYFSCAPVLDESGEYTGFVGSILDITERRKAQDALKKSEERYRDIFKTAAVSIWEEDFTAIKAAIDDLKAQGVTDFKKYLDEYPEFVLQASKMVKVVDINEATIKMFGAASKEEMLGSLDKVFVPESLPTFREQIVAMAEGQTRFESESVNQTLQGERLNILMTISFPSEAEKFRSVLVSIMDITERKRAEEALKDYSEQLEEMVKERTHELEAAHEELVKREKLSVLGRMTAIVSHELRNPLGVIRSSAYYLNSRLDNADEKTRKHLERIEQQVGHCDSIVDELLEYTRGRRSEMLEESLNPWLEGELDQIEIPDRVRLDYEPSPDIPMVHFDQEKLRRVVINLVENALQAVIARQEGLKKEDDPYQSQVKVSTSITDNGVCIEVEDNGIGMDAETVKYAFEPLFTSRARGTGLGLAIVKKIVEEHGGTIFLDSEPGLGTKAAVMIPVHTDAPNN